MLVTILDLADRAGVLAGIGPIDPDPEANTPDRYRTVAWHRSIPRIDIDPFAQFRVLTRLYAYPFGRILVRVGRVASVAISDRAGRVHPATQ